MGASARRYRRYTAATCGPAGPGVQTTSTTRRPRGAARIRTVAPRALIAGQPSVKNRRPPLNDWGRAVGAHTSPPNCASYLRQLPVPGRTVLITQAPQPRLGSHGQALAQRPACHYCYPHATSDAWAPLSTESEVRILSIFGCSSVASHLPCTCSLAHCCVTFDVVHRKPSTAGPGQLLTRSATAGLLESRTSIPDSGGWVRGERMHPAWAF